MKKLILLSTLLPLSANAALVEMWKFNDLGQLGAIADGTNTTGVFGGIATIRGAGALSTITGGQGSFAVDLPGGSSATAAYIDLPNGIVSSLTDATFETWVTQSSNQAWGRLFDFGTNSNGEQTGPGGAGQGTDYLIFSLNRGTDPLTQRMEYVNDTAGAGSLDSNANITLGTEHHIVVTFDNYAPNFSIALWYLDGVFQSGGVMSAPLSGLSDVNNWLGRSNWGGDANTDASYDQFALYDTTWTPAEVSAAFAAGPLPEPSGAIMLAGSLLGLLARRRRA